MTTQHENFDFHAFAERRGFSERERATLLAELLGLSPGQMRRILGGQGKPSKTLVIAAQALDRLVELENAERERKRHDFEEATRLLRGSAGTDMTTDAILDETRERDRRS